MASPSCIKPEKTKQQARSGSKELVSGRGEVDLSPASTAIILLVAAALPFLRQLFLGAGILDDDLFGQSLPAWEWYSRVVRSGDSILWCPEILGGLPMAFTQYPFLYPPSFVLAWLLPPFQAYAWSLVIHLFLAGFLTYCYCRTIGIRSRPSLLAALSFQLSTEVATGVSGFAASSIFVLPGTILSIELMMQRGRRYGLLLAVVIAAAFLGGHLPAMVWGIAVAGAYTLYRLVSKAFVAPGSAAWDAVSILASCALGIALASVRLIPMWETMSLSFRSGSLPSSIAAGGAISLQGLLVGYLLPLSHVQTLSWGSPSYVGPAVLVFAVLGLRSVLVRPFAAFFVITSIVTCLLSMGDATPLHWLTRLPVLSQFRDISRVSIVTGFCLSILGGMALDQYYRDKSCDLRQRAGFFKAAAVISLAAIGAAFVLGALFTFSSILNLEVVRTWFADRGLDGLNPLRPRMGLALLALPAVFIVLTLFAVERLSRQWMERLMVGIVLVVLVPIATILRPSIDVESLARVPDTVRFLQDQPGLFRTYSHAPWLHMYNHMMVFGPMQEEGFSDDFRYRYEAETLAPNLCLRWGVYSADGYDPLHSRWQEVVLRYILSDQVARWAQLSEKWPGVSFRDRVRVLSMLNVRYLISATDLSQEVPELKPVTRVDVDAGLSRASPGVLVFENTGFLPRYYLVAQGRKLSDSGDPLYEVATGRVDPSAVVLLQETNNPTGVDLMAAENEAAELWNRSVDLLSYRNDQIEIRAVTSKPAYLVTSDSYWPGWRAFVDGKEVPLWRANVNGRAVWLDEPGSHTVRFQFEPPGFALGWKITSAALVTWALLLGMSVYSTRRILR